MSDRSKRGRPERRKTFIIRKPAQMRALTSPARQEIVDAVAASGPLSVKEIAASVGRKPSSLYYHVSALRDAGLLFESGRRKGNMREEAVYATPGKYMRLAPQESARGVYGTIVASMLRVAGRDFRRALDGGAELAAVPRKMWGGRMKGWVTKADVRKIDVHIESIMKILSQRRAGPACRLHAMTWVHAPVGPGGGDRPSKR